MDKPTITPLPTPPNRQQGAAEFATRADEFLSALPVFGSESNDVATFVDGRAAAAEQFAANAQSSANTANTRANAATSSAQTAQGYAAQTAADRQAVENALINGPVIEVNGKSGVVNLTAQDVTGLAGVGTNAVGNRTISAGDPSGGANGDIHYKVAG